MPLEWAEVYFGENLKMIPTSERRMVVRFWIWVFAIGSSSPFVSTRLSDCALNWQNAPKRSIAWKPSVVAALKINNLSDGGAT